MVKVEHGVLVKLQRERLIPGDPVIFNFKLHLSRRPRIQGKNSFFISFKHFKQEFERLRAGKQNSSDAPFGYLGLSMDKEAKQIGWFDFYPFHNLSSKPRGMAAYVLHHGLASELHRRFPDFSIYFSQDTSQIDPRMVRHLQRIGIKPGTRYPISHYKQRLENYVKKNI